MPRSVSLSGMTSKLLLPFHLGLEDQIRRDVSHMARISTQNDLRIRLVSHTKGGRHSSHTKSCA